jgi:hypothetical protein
MPRNSGEDLWNLAFSNVGRKGDQRRNDNDVAQAIQAISGITATSRRSYNMTGEVTIHDLGEQVGTHGSRRLRTATGFSAHGIRRNSCERSNIYISAVSLSPPISWNTWSACTAPSWDSSHMESRRTALRDTGDDGRNTSWSALFSWIRTTSA